MKVVINIQRALLLRTYGNYFSGRIGKGKKLSRSVEIKLPLYNPKTNIMAELAAKPKPKITPAGQYRKLIVHLCASKNIKKILKI